MKGPADPHLGCTPAALADIQPCTVPPSYRPSHCRLADQLFAACYKANARLLQSGAAGAGELQTVRQAANRHAAFVLHVRCGRPVGCACASGGASSPRSHSSEPLAPLSPHPSLQLPVV